LGQSLSDWIVIESKRFQWLRDRFREALQHIELLRIDQFCVLDRYWNIPATANVLTVASV
jgi:4-alpha-glucanotransferase